METLEEDIKLIFINFTTIYLCPQVNSEYSAEQESLQCMLIPMAAVENWSYLETIF